MLKQKQRRYIINGLSRSEPEKYRLSDVFAQIHGAIKEK